MTFGRDDNSLSQAQRLFDALRELDEKGAKNVLSRHPSKHGVGLAVCNRLYRAAAFRFINAIKRPIVGLTGPTGAGKGEAVRWLAKHMGVEIENTMGFGDYLNDLEMLGAVGCPVAVGNAADEVKQIAKMVVPACADDGVAQTIEKYVLGAQL